MQLNDYRKKASDKLSGGNKRKVDFYILTINSFVFQMH